MSHFSPSGSNFTTSLNIISWGENGVCMCGKSSAAGNVRQSFIYFFSHLACSRPLFFIFFTSLLSCFFSGSIYLHYAAERAFWQLFAIVFPPRAMIVTRLEHQEKTPKSIYPCRLSRWLPLMAGVQMACTCWWGFLRAAWKPDIDEFPCFSVTYDSMKCVILTGSHPLQTDRG